ncbi:hypothetical protein [Paraburkholderia sp. SIMBA_054]|uniref:hypothetical protein n=1 Tax=Paraburkholderia sp. SIMBA_054 TaxID=3085795 RepID=UPI003979A1BF
MNTNQNLNRATAETRARREHQLYAGMTILAYEIVTRKAGLQTVHRLAAPVRLRIAAGADGVESHWEEGWLKSLWRVSLVAPHRVLFEADELLVRGSEFSSDHRSIAGSVACVATGRAQVVARMLHAGRGAGIHTCPALVDTRPGSDLLRSAA